MRLPNPDRAGTVLGIAVTALLIGVFIAKIDVRSTFASMQEARDAITTGQNN